MSYIDLASGLLRAHEVVDNNRLDALIESITTMGICVPVVVARFAGEWIVIDGAHRTQAAIIAGLAEIPCRVLRISADRQVDGWARRYTEPIQVDYPLRCGPVVACCADVTGQMLPVRSSSQDPMALWETAWEIERQLPGAPYIRLPDLVPGSLRWQPPSWGTIAHCALRFGPWPAGFTNFQQTFTSRPGAG